MATDCPFCQKPMEMREIPPRRFYERCFGHGVWMHLSFFRWFKGAEQIGVELQRARTTPVASQDKALTCPRCRTPMMITRANLRSEIQVDQCVRCNHVWFDAGELERINQSGELMGEFPRAELRQTSPAKAPSNFMPSQTNRSDFESRAFNPLAAMGLPIEEDREGVRTFPAAAFFIIFISLLTTARGLRSSAFLEKYAFYPDQPFLHAGANLFMATLLHAGIWHFITNMYMLWIVGDNIEEREGSKFLLFLFWSAALVGHLASTILGSHQPTIGASGGVAGLLAFYICAFPKNRLEISLFLWRGFSPNAQTISLSAPWFFIVWFAIQVWGATQQNMFGTSGINFYAHIAGAIAGLLFYFTKKPA